MSSDIADQSVESAIRSLIAAARQLEASTASATRGVVDSKSALEAIAAAEQALPRANDSAETRAASMALRASRAELLAGELAMQRAKLAQLTRQIARIRSARTVDDLASAIPIEAAGLGYGRALFSWVEDEKWLPHSAHAEDNPHEARAIVNAGGPPYQEIRSLHEVHLVRQRRPILILDATHNPRVHPTIIPVTQSVTYTASPIVARGRVAGMVHIDRNLETGYTDEFDRDLLSLFCENIGVTLERLLMAGDAESPEPSGATAEWWGTLTERERDVLRLIAEGLTNTEIAARLYVSPETAKSHTKRLMRKMGVSTRSQAGALFHTSQ